MDDPRINPETATGRIYAKALELLAENPDGMRWKDLLAEIERYDPTLHPKTVNGCVWKLTERFPDLVHKPSKGVFQLIDQQG